MKFNGDFEVLRRAVEEAARQCKTSGTWTEQEHGKQQFRANNGAILCWWPSTGTIQFQGPTDRKKALEMAVGSHLKVDSGSPSGALLARESPVRTQIFVVHGHDTHSRDQLELALRRLGLEPFILMNASGSGKTIIEALEGRIGRDYSSDFGIVLLTPDDMGYAKRDGREKEEPRARQNVILETGMLLSSLTRQRIAILQKGHVDLPSDLQGVIRLNFNDHISEIVPKLVARLREAGIEVDQSRLTDALG